MQLAATPSAPDAETREHLLDELASLIERDGAGTFLAAPIVPNERSFPEPWKPTRAGVEALLRRLLWHANIDRTVATDDHRSGAPPTERKPETRVPATAIGTRKASFIIEFVGSDDVVGTLAHEVGVIHAALTRIEDAGPYRQPAPPDDDREDDDDRDDGGDHDGTDDDARNHRDDGHGGRHDDARPGTTKARLDVDLDIDHDRDLERGSIATVYLGLGVVATNAAYQQYSQAGRFNGAYVPLEYEVLTAGYLPMSSLAFLLAVQTIVRGERAAPAGLSGPQRDEVTAWLDALAGHRGELRERLGIADDAVAAERPEVVPFDVELADDEAPKKIAFRWRTNRGFIGLLAGATLGGGVAMAIARQATPIVMVVSTVAGHLVGRRVKVPRCTACATVVGPNDATCPHCGADLVLDIAHLSDRLDAEERWEREHRRGAARRDDAAAAETDA